MGKKGTTCHRHGDVHCNIATVDMYLEEEEASLPLLHDILLVQISDVSLSGMHPADINYEWQALTDSSAPHRF